MRDVPKAKREAVAITYTAQATQADRSASMNSWITCPVHRLENFKLGREATTMQVKEEHSAIAKCQEPAWNRRGAVLYAKTGTM